jgi:hypothetical protein
MATPAASTEQPSNQKAPPPSGLAFYNYCVAFIDLLGQRDAMRGQTILPDKNQAEAVFRDVIGPIVYLQRDAENMLKPLNNPDKESPRRASLPPEQQALWDEMMRSPIQTQRWSDGIMSFACLGDRTIKCPVGGVFHLLGLAGSMLLLGLARKKPVRGAVDIAWGVELHPNELYGPAVARAYELESEVAGYPRIVVGAHVYNYLRSHIDNKDNDVYAENNRTLAKICLDMLTQDSDGRLIVHILGEGFTAAVNKKPDLYPLIRTFVHEQIERHQREGNTKLAFRYWHLMQYVEMHPPKALIT